jgi:hypothetical protein
MILLRDHAPRRAVLPPIGMNRQHDVPLAGEQRRIGLIPAIADRAEGQRSGVGRPDRPFRRGVDGGGGKRIAVAVDQQQRRVIPICLKNHPFTGSDRCDTLSVDREPIPCVAAGANDVSV